MIASSKKKEVLKNRSSGFSSIFSHIYARILLKYNIYSISCDCNLLVIKILNWFNP